MINERGDPITISDPLPSTFEPPTVYKAKFDPYGTHSFGKDYDIQIIPEFCSITRTNKQHHFFAHYNDQNSGLNDHYMFIMLTDAFILTSIIASFILFIFFIALFVFLFKKDFSFVQFM